MGIWDSIKGGAGAAWDQTGGRAWDAHQRANEEGRIFGLNPDKNLYKGLDWWTNEMESVGDSMLHGQEGRDPADDINIFTLGQAIGDQWRPTEVPPPEPVISGPTIFGPGVTDPTPEQVAAAEDALLAFEESQRSLQSNDPFVRPNFDPTAITGPYGDYTAAANQAFDEYTAMLEGISTAPRTSRIEEMYGLATDEASRRLGAANTWEATQGERLESDFAARGELLGGLHEEFNTELDLIREASGDRREGAKAEREARIDQMIADADLGEAAATFIVSSTKTSDILDAQGTRQQVYDDRMDRLYAGWELDRTMALAGLESNARRDLADDVMAMREVIHQFSYDAGQERLGRLFVAEENAAQRETDMLTTLAELGYGHAGQMADVGLQQDLAVAGAEDAFDTQWDRAQAFYENPVTANAFFGMDPSMMAGADPQTMFDNWLAIQQMQADAAGEAVGGLWQDPRYGQLWADLYVTDPATGATVLDPKVIGQVAGALGMAESEVTARLGGDLAGV